MFTTRLAEHAAQKGVDFRYKTSIQSIARSGDGVSVFTDAGEYRGDACIVALGSYSPHLLRLLGISIPVYPVKGYSIAVPIVDDAMAPMSTIMDETYKIAITRLGSRIRVGGTAELAGYDRTLRPGRRLARGQRPRFLTATATPRPVRW